MSADPSPQASRKGSQLDSGPPSQNEKSEPDQGKGKDKPNVFRRFALVFRKVIFHSWINLLLVFVPVGIAVNFVPGMSPGVIFAMNAIAIVPLAGLLSHATETVAHRFGDAIGALMNVTFGNAVELIIFIIALVKDEIRIVQASLLGSILANLLLILGMCFVLGGLRFREQIYNSTVTQMSACLLSLSVISLVLPTAFHASFSNNDKADQQSLIISRGTSVVLLLVYIIYLVFQLKSHAYMYESTPQDVIDAESTPGPAVAWFDSSSSDSSSSSSSDSDSSGHSRDTVSKRVKRMVRHGRRRKSSVASVDTVETVQTSALRSSPSLGTTISPTNEDGPTGEPQARPGVFGRTISFEGDESAIEDEISSRRYRKKHKRSKRDRKYRKKHRSHTHGTNSPTEETIDESPENAERPTATVGEPRRVDFALDAVPGNGEGAAGEGGVVRRPFNPLLSLKPAAKSLTPTVFTHQANQNGVPAAATGPIPRVRYGIRRTNSLPGRLNNEIRPPGAMLPSQIPARALPTLVAAEEAAEDPYADDLSRTSAVILLLCSTGLVALCAEFMVDSINGLVETSTISEAFIGLIVLPIVGNAAEHVTAITVAMKNKMDLAIGVAVGSSIQIALFITPLTVILGWIMQKEMTLYFTLFETVCLFVSAFIANFLVLDGRSNYLEGALLCTTYVIIALAAFFYPNAEDASVWG